MEAEKREFEAVKRAAEEERLQKREIEAAKQTPGEERPQKIEQVRAEMEAAKNARALAKAKQE